LPAPDEVVSSNAEPQPREQHANVSVYRIFWPLYVLPVAVLGGLLLAVKAGGGVEDFYVDKALPWLITTWIGAGFTSTWEMLRVAGRSAPRGVLAATAVLSALVILGMLGGPSVLWEDPWIFGVAVWPGLQLAAKAVSGSR
jgi:hypothetical protein